MPAEMPASSTRMGLGESRAACTTAWPPARVALRSVL